MRAFRPSYFAPLEEREEDVQLEEKEANVEVYARLAEKGLPLFEGAHAIHPFASQGPNLLAQG